ncbi:MAG TPA: alpha/beta hydrolase [Polyangiaceae bacterium]|jgi:pimeloyl-ACP methyl ester carboxylesterase|nr:alpha/beta hydrolase [Polyangiaceae bacterium]
MSKSILWTTLCTLSLACSAEVSSPEAVELELGSTASALRTGLLSTGVELEFTEQGARPGDAVILVHGYADSHRAYSQFAKTFPRNFHVFLLDQRGQGDSSKPDCCYGLRNDFARDVIAFMDSQGIQRAHLVGHSMGGIIAQSVAMDFPDRVRSLVLIGTAPTMVGNPFGVGIAPVIDSLVDPVPPELLAQLERLLLFSDVPDSILNDAVQDALKVPAAILQAMFDSLLTENRSDALGSIQAPTLILFGDQDPVFSLADQQLLDSGIPDSSLIVYPQTGHRPQTERSVEVGRDIASFLRRH